MTANLPTSLATIGGEDLAGDQPIDQHADGGQVLLDRRLLKILTERLDIGGDVERLDVGELAEFVAIAPVEEPHDGNRRGIPQGSPLSPLLANLYMRRFVLGWKKLGLEQSLGTRLVTYADDLVILCRRGSAETALHYLREIMGKLKLTVNEEKTRICKVPEGEFDFLGYTFGRMYSPTTGKARLGHRPSKKSIKRMVEKVPRADRPSAQLARDHRARRHVKPRASRVDQLLQCRHHQQSLSRARQLHGCAVAPVAAIQAQGQAT